MKNPRARKKKHQKTRIELLKEIREWQDICYSLKSKCKHLEDDVAKVTQERNIAILHNISPSLRKEK